jgi:hypothetical protein
MERLERMFLNSSKAMEWASGVLSHSEESSDEDLFEAATVYDLGLNFFNALANLGFISSEVCEKVVTGVYHHPNASVPRDFPAFSKN